MSRLDQFFVLVRPGTDDRPWPGVEPGWRTRDAGRFLLGWRAARAGSVSDGALPNPSLTLPALEVGDGDGVFAQATLDGDRVTITTDRFGLMPVYSCRQGGLLGYSTSLRALLSMLRSSLALDPSSVAEMLVLQMPLGDRTLLRDVKLVPPATKVTLGDGEPTLTSTFDWHSLTPREPADLVRDTYALIEDAVLRAVPPGAKKVAVPLSGGLDSRLLAAILAKHGVPVQAYNIDFGTEARIAREAAAVMRIPLKPLPMLADAAAVPAAHAAIDGAYHINQVWGWSMARAAAEDGCDALFDGLAFDTILGSIHHVAGTDVSALARNLEGNYADIAEPALSRAIGYSASSLFAMLRESLAQRARHAIDVAGPLASDQFLMTNRIRKYTFGYCLANLHQLPGRFPYVTSELFDHCLRLPREQRDKHTLYRRIYQEIFPELARVPWAKTGLPLDQYRPAERPRWKLYLEALVRRATRGRLSLDGRGSVNVLLRRRGGLRAEFERVLAVVSPELNAVLPEQVTAQALALHLAGRDLAGLLQSLYTIKHFIEVSRAAVARPTRPMHEEAVR